MSSFLSKRGSASEIDLSLAVSGALQPPGRGLTRKKSGSSLRNLFSRGSRKSAATSDDGAGSSSGRSHGSNSPAMPARSSSMTANKNNSNNSNQQQQQARPPSLQLLSSAGGAPDYRTFLRMKRPPTRVPRRPHSSDDSLDDSDDDEASDSDDDGAPVTPQMSTDAWAAANGLPVDHRASSTANNVLMTSEMVSGTPSHLPPPPPAVMKITDPDEALAHLGALDNHVLLKIAVVEQKLTKCFRVEATETCWTLNQRILQSLAKKPELAFNYGLFCKKAGRFLLDHKQLSEYVEAGSVATYEFRYKRRVFHQAIRNSKDSRRLVKMQSSSRQRELMTSVRERNTDRVHHLIRKGIDPNFVDHLSQETPLTAAVTSPHLDDSDLGATPQSTPTLVRRGADGSADAAPLDRRCAPVILALVGGGAHLDFRNKRGLAPLHVAVRTGNLTAVKTLLELGASPDVADSRELTPLYHCCLLGTSLDCTRVVLESGARLRCADSQGWNLLHQVCRYGRLGHLDAILAAATESSDDGPSMLDSRNASGNTPLHVCALYNKELCLVTLLQHGCDHTLRNFANQDPAHVAIVAGNINLAHLIKDYPKMGDKEHPLLKQRNRSAPVLAALGSAAPSSGDNFTTFRRHTVTAASIAKGGGSNSSADNKPKTPTATAEHSRLAKRQSFQGNSLQRYDADLPPNATLPRHSFSAAHRLSVLEERDDDNSPDRTDGASSRNDHVTTTSDDVTSSRTELLYIACQDYEPRNSDELALRIGDRVCVSADHVCGGRGDEVTDDGLCQASVGDRRGLVPLRCVQPVKLRKHPSTRHDAPAGAATNHKSGGQLPASAEVNGSEVMRTLPKIDYNLPATSSTNPAPAATNGAGENPVVGTSEAGILHRPIEVMLRKGRDGYGFVLRGAKADGSLEMFTPTPQYPALQYLESVEAGGMAHSVGLRSGDFIMKINSVDVTNMGHRQIVEFIRHVGDPLRMRVVSVITNNAADDVAERRGSTDDGLPPRPSTISSPIPAQPDMTSSRPSPADTKRLHHKRTGSVVSAIGKLDQVLANMGDMSDDDQLDNKAATLRRRPVSRAFRSRDIQQQDMFTQPSQPATPASSSTPQPSSASSRRLIRVLPPSLPADGGDDPDEQQESYVTPPRAVDPVRTLPHPPSANNNHVAHRGDNNHDSAAAAQHHDSARSSRTNSVGSDRSCDRNRASSRTSASGGVKKSPPPPPKRTDSRLSSTSNLPPSTPNSDKLSIASSGDREGSVSSLDGATAQLAPSSVRSSFRTGSTATPGKTPSGFAPRKLNLPIEVGSLAAAVAAAAEQRRRASSSSDEQPTVATTTTSSKPPPVVSPKPLREKGGSVSAVVASLQQKQTATTPGDDEGSAFALALRAKQASLGGKQDDTVPRVTFKPQKPPRVADKSLSSKQDMMMQLPPPPPPVTSLASSSSSFALPPPPPPPACSSHHELFSHPKFGEAVALPPPPDELTSCGGFGVDLPPPTSYSANVVNGDDSSTIGSILPPARFNDQSSRSGDVTTTTAHQHHHAADNVSNTDSGIDDRAPPPSGGDTRCNGMSNVETGSIVSTISSEDGSDVGVSLSYDPKSASEAPNHRNIYLDALKKHKSVPTTTTTATKEPTTAPITLTKVKFGGAAATPPAPAPKPAQTSSESSAPDFVSAKPLDAWTSAEVGEWLRHLGLAMHVDQFAENDIDGSHLPELGKDDLAELGVTRIGHRLTIERSLKKLRQVAP